MRNGCDLKLGGVEFIAIEPCDARMIRRGGVVIWARRGGDGWRAISVCEARMISLLAGLGPPEADTLLISPPITDGRRLRGVRGEVESALRMRVGRGLAAE